MTNVKNMIWKRLNFTAVKSKTKGNVLGTNQLTKTLQHSLRIIQKHGKEFNLDLKMDNLIVHDNKIIQLETLSKDERKAILKSIVEPAVQISESKHEATVNNRDLSKYSYKLKQLIQKNELPEFSEFLENILAKKETIDKGETLAQLELLTLKRKDQKKSCLSIYIDLHNSKVELSKPIHEDFHKKRTVVQEAFWKFPFNQCVDYIKPAHYINTINSFYKEHFPDYPVKLIVFHGDEISSPHDNGLSVHPHIFIDGKNSKTNKYDIIDQEFRMVNKFRASKGLEPLDRHDGKYSTAVQLGVDYQEMIYKHVNEKLAAYQYDISVEVIPDSPAKKLRNRLIKKDASLPKIDRLYNSINKSTKEVAELEISLKNKAKEKEKLDKELEIVLSKNRIYKKENNNLTKENDELTSSIEANKPKVLSTVKNIDILKETERLLSYSLSSKVDEIRELDIQIEDKRSYYQKLTDAFSSVKNFVEACIQRSIHYNQSKPDKTQLQKINEQIKLIHQELDSPDGQKYTNEVLDELEVELEKHDIPVIFEGGLFSKRKNRLAKIK